MLTDEQLAAYLAGEMPEAERASFEEAALGDDAARHELLAQRRISAGLHALLGDAGPLAQAILTTTRGLSDETMAKRIATARAPRPVPVRQPVQAKSRVVRRAVPVASPSRNAGRGWAWTLALLIITVAFVAWQWPRTPKCKAPSVAVVATVEAVSDSSLAVGAPLKAGAFELARGVAQLRFSSGATMVVQAPAQLDLIGANEAALRRGRVLVEAAGGFVVGTPQGPVRDIGTRFGVAVRDAQSAEAHVFDGRVEMAGENLGAGEALAVSPGTMTRKPADAAVFPTPQRIIAEPLVGGGFDRGVNVRVDWFVDRAGEWVGDRCEVVGPTLGVQPHAGNGMLRFVRAERGEEGKEDYSKDAEEWQIVDLAPFRAALVRGGRAELSARFNRVSGGAERFTVVVRTFGGSLARRLQRGSGERAQVELGRVEVPLIADADPATWQAVETSVPVAPEASYIEVMIAANRGPERRALNGHFADSITLRIVEPPRASTR